MDDVSFAHGLHALDDLRKEVHGLVFGQFGVVGNVFRQIASFTVLKENVEVGLGLFDIDEVDDVLIFAVVEEVNFALEDVDFVV